MKTDINYWAEPGASYLCCENPEEKLEETIGSGSGVGRILSRRLRAARRQSASSLRRRCTRHVY